MKDEVARSDREFDSLDSLIRFIVPLDNRLRVRDSEKKREESEKAAKSSSFKAQALPSQVQVQERTRIETSSSPASTTSTFRPSRPTTEEYERRARDYLCYRCGRKGHIGRDFPTRSSWPAGYKGQHETESRVKRPLESTTRRALAR